MLVRFYIADLFDCMIYVHELKIKLLTSSFRASQASCRVSFPLVVLTPKSLEFS